jgi:hypothetical protein
MRRYVVTLLLSVVLVLGTHGPAWAQDDPSAGEWPITSFGSEVSGLEPGMQWVRTNPMLITSLSASMGTPPPAVVADYFGPFGATAKMLWEDGAAEVDGWNPSSNPFISWLRSDGTSSVWNGFAFESTGELVGGMAGKQGRIGFQVGDEAGSVTALAQIQAGIESVRAADPDALVYTNMSIYVANADDVLAYWVSNVDADVLMSSDYFFDHLHYSALERYRARALQKGVPYWQYLNAYVGAESGFDRSHTESDLRWQAMVGLLYGYTGHSWFIYQAADGARHSSATAWGGSALFDGVGDWAAPKTDAWKIVADINEELANLGPTMTQLTSVDVRFIRAVHPRAVTPLGTRPWARGAAGDPYLAAIRAAAGEAPMDIPVGFFRDATGQRYVMVQNGRHTHSVGFGSDPLPGAESPGRIRLEFDFTGAPFTVDRTTLEYLDPGDGRVKALALQQVPAIGGVDDEGEEIGPNPDLRFAEPLLAPGAVLLFKYADTIPFRLGPTQDGVGVVDPTQGLWHLRDRAGVRSFYFGDPGDVPFMGDWNCDGTDTPGLYRQSDGFVYLRNSNTQGIADVRFFFGNPGDIPLAGDFNGDGCDTVSIYRPSEAQIFVIDRLGSDDGGLGAAERSYFFGDVGDRPFVGDFDGDGIDTIGLHRTTTGLVYMRNSHTQGNADIQFIFGDPGDRIVAGDWQGTGTDSVGLFRDQQARFYLRFTNSPGDADVDFLFGEPGFRPIAGNF